MLAIHHTEFWVFAAFVVLGELVPIRVPGRAGELAISTTFTFALLLTFGLGPAVAVQAAASLVADVASRKPWRRTLFNAGQYTLSWAAAGGALALTGGIRPVAAHGMPLGYLLAILLAGGVFFVVNSALARTAVALDRGFSVLAHLVKDLGFRAWTTVMLIGLAPAVAAVAQSDLLVVPLIVLPLAAIHRSEREALKNEHLAYHDPLTGLPNRVLFRDRVEQAILAARRGGWSVAVMVMDLDRFKEINDTLGHQQGDVLLREIGPRLAEELRASDTVARLGGDEFAILLPRVDSDAITVNQVAERLQLALDEPFAIEDIALAVRASIGIAMHPDH
ncbi:MAG: hypothetical protein QOI98_2491, partial [Solirubrobacteraceae bacterium]|nr:hypothetical protein [Solirubrobacteraceae bacterium]